MTVAIRVLVFLLVLSLAYTLIRDFQLWLALLYPLAGVAGLVASRFTRLRWMAALMGGGLALVAFFAICIAYFLWILAFTSVSSEDPVWVLVAIYVFILSPLVLFAGIIAGWLAEDFRQLASSRG